MGSFEQVPAPNMLQVNRAIGGAAINMFGEVSRPYRDPFEVADTSDLEETTSWQERSLCAQTDPEEFFPEKGGSTRQAKKVCLSCEVQTECLDYALANNERFGIWGGLSERERRKLQKRG